jgi:hypothetical protein
MIMTDHAAGEKRAPSKPDHASRTALASVAAIGSVLAASSCCLPVLPFLFAAGAAGGSAFLTTTRPYLRIRIVNILLGRASFSGVCRN